MNDQLDPQKIKEIAQTTYRVANNLMVLLDIGLFPGKHAVGIEECRGLVKAIVDDAKNKMEPQIMAKTPTANVTPA